MHRYHQFLRRTLHLVFFASIGLAGFGAFAFDMKDTEGASQRLASLNGKWVVVNFWATWCAPCVKEIPDIAEFAKSPDSIAKGVRVIGVALDWFDGTKPTAVEQTKIKAFAKKVGHSYPLVLGDEVTEKFFGKAKGLPRTIIYDPSGKVAFEKTGPVTKALLARVIAGEKI
ncbi:MAG: TlpA disulfide reductase family protein [Usitatibacteraceae bacterium]